ncbi:hypothetical protein HELRODRAFT_183636 [Helobdella robusta]|uniref:Uncharacterized protein n=1 Tax=Helobdella robusta TaxID=6412 RepID=T1FJZ0_HELRO|nr:hypothetical protein HELRODRAFT_183636 [Helobdella robusta]ESO10414.1 hypothetical protein HELRODRAFT_183636 [Helobdella robusta]
MSTASSTDHSVPAQWKQQTIFSCKSGKRNFTTEEDVEMIENLPLWKKELLIKKQKHLQNQPHQQHKNGLLLNSPPKESSPDGRPTSTSYFYPAVECRRKKSHSRSTNSSLPDLLDDVVYKEEKAKKRLSVNVVSKRKDLVGDDDEDDDTAVREERILPIHLNPILKMDLERRMNEKTTAASAMMANQQQLLIKSPNRESKCLDVRTQDELKTVQSISDSVFENSIDIETKGPSKNNYNINNNNNNNENINIISNNMSNNIDSICSNKRFLKSYNDRNVTNIDDDDDDDDDENNDSKDNVDDDFLLFNNTSNTTTTTTTAAVATTTASTTTTTTTSKKLLPAKRDFAHDVNVNSNNFSVKLRPTTPTPTATTKIGDGDDDDDNEGDGDGDDKSKSIAQLINKFSTGSPVNKVRSHNNISKNISPTLEDGFQMTTSAATVATASATSTTTTDKPLIVNTTTTIINNNNRYNNSVNESLTKTQVAPNSFKFTSKTTKQFKSAVTNGPVESVDLVDGNDNDKGSNFSNSSGTAVYTSSTSTTTILPKITTPGKVASAKISTPISTTTTSINTNDVNDINSCNNIFSSLSCSSSSGWQGMTAKKNVAVDVVRASATSSKTLSILTSTSTNVNNSLATSNNNTSELANKTTPLNNLNSVTSASSAITTTTTSTTTKPSQTLIPRPGKLLIRHSVPTATSINNANDSNTDSSGGSSSNNKLDLRLLPRYTDIRKGEFLPTSQDLLDVLADILGTNDDGPDDAILDFEFLGAGVLLEKSMLTKTRNGKLVGLFVCSSMCLFVCWLSEKIRILIRIGHEIYDCVYSIEG